METTTSATESEVVYGKDRQSLHSSMNGDTMKCDIHGQISSVKIKDSVETSAPASDGDGEKSLQFAEELTKKGSMAVKEHDFIEATDCFSRALEIRAALYGELSLDCLELYYKYGSALLSKAQEESDPLVTLPNTEDNSLKKEEEKKRSNKSVLNSESSSASVGDEVELDKDSTPQEGAKENEGEEDEEESDGEDINEADDEDETDLDLAWKMLDLARVIADRQPANTVMKAHILSALAEVSLEREDIDTSLCDYQKAVSILEHLVTPDNRYLAELNFRICLCLEIGSRADEAIPYCEKAISICKSRIQHLSEQPSNSVTETAGEEEEGKSVEKEIETLSGLAGELGKKLEDLQQLVQNPTSVLSEIMDIMSAAKATKLSEKATPQIGSSQIGVCKSGESSDSATGSTAHTGGEAAAGVVHLGVVGRGVKRVVTNHEVSESDMAAKRRDLSSVSENEEAQQQH